MQAVEQGYVETIHRLRICTSHGGEFQSIANTRVDNFAVFTLFTSEDSPRFRVPLRLSGNPSISAPTSGSTSSFNWSN